jgi:hypothetical protein
MASVACHITPFLARPLPVMQKYAKDSLGKYHDVLCAVLGCGAWVIFNKAKGKRDCIKNKASPKH